MTDPRVCIRCEREIDVAMGVCPLCGRNQNRREGEQAETDVHEPGGLLIFALFSIGIPAAVFGALGYGLSGWQGLVVGVVAGPIFFHPFDPW